MTALDVQLKVLQALPSLLQNYGASLSGKLLTAAFEVSFLLYGSKTAVVSNTAAAALQQLVTATFEKAAFDNGTLCRESSCKTMLTVSDDAFDDEPSLEVPVVDGVVSVHGAASDAYRVSLWFYFQRHYLLNLESSY